MNVISTFIKSKSLELKLLKIFIPTNSRVMHIGEYLIICSILFWKRAEKKSQIKLIKFRHVF